jgi:hypothetical protein
MSTFTLPQRVVVQPRRSIATFDMMVVLRESGTDTLEITRHPVQDGSSITDHAFVQPKQLEMEVVFGNTEARTIKETYQKLLDLQASALPFDVVTGKRAYKNMLFASISNTTDSENENVLSLSFSLQEIRIVQVEVAVVPPRSRQAQPAKTSGTQNSGTKSAQEEIKPQRRQSILSSIAGGF